MKLGQFQIDVVSDGTFSLDGGAMFGVVPRVLWQRHFEPDSLNRVRLGLNALLVRTPTTNILIETGIGRKWEQKQSDMYAMDSGHGILDELARIGLSAGDIDVVINTHLHFDHSGTNTIRENGVVRPAFHRARYVVQRGELEHARTPHERDRASYLPENFEPLAEAGLFDIVDGDAELEPGVRLLKVAGHNRDLQCVRLDSGGETAFFFSDLMPTTAHIAPAWVMSYDLYPVETLEQKKRFIPQAVEEGWVCVFYHDPKIALGRLRQDGARTIVDPVDPGL